jgi:hypothetical protein
MKRRLRQRLLIGIAVAAVLAGATAAVVMAAQPSGAAHHHNAADHRKRGMLATAANYLGLSTAQLGSELESGKSLAQVADATPGKSQAGLVEALEAADRQKLAAASADLPRRIVAEVNRAGDRLAGGARAGRRHAGTLPVAALYLGVSTAQLRHDLRSGTSLALLAKASSGKSEAGLIEALVAAKKTQLATLLAAGTITQAKANKVLPRLLARVTAQVNRTRHRTRHQHAPASY